MLLDLEPYGVNSYPDFQLQMTLFSCAGSILFKYSILSFARNKDSLLLFLLPHFALYFSMLV